MKRYIALLLVFVMLLLAACDTVTPPAETTPNTGSTTNSTEAGGTDASQNSTGSNTNTSPNETTENTGGNSSTAATEETSMPTNGENAADDYTLKLSAKSLTLDVGQIGNLRVEYTGTGTLYWESRDSAIATVSNGKIVAVSQGTTVITVTDGVKQASCSVTINKKAEKPVEVTLTLSATTAEMKVGDIKTLSVTYTGTKSLNWTTTNSAIVSVSNGKLTAKAAGTAFVNVDDGVYTATCKVVVTNKQAPVEVTLSVNPTTLNLVVGNTSTLTASYNGTGTLSWSTDNSSVAMVSNGIVTAKGAGTATITVTAGSKKATCKVTVTAPAPVTATLKIKTKNNTKMNVGDTLQVDYTYTGTKSLTWSSDDTSILTISNSGVVTAKSAGATFIEVTDGTLSKSIMITVEANKPKVTEIKKDEFNAPLYDGVVKYAGDYMTFYAWTLPYESNREMMIASSNTSVVSVSYSTESNQYRITLNFKSAGSATITLKSADGAKSESYRITVKSGYNSPHGYGQLTPEQFVDCFNEIVSANGMSTSVVSGYLVLTLSDSKLNWDTVRREAEADFHHWYSVGKKHLCLTYEGTNADGNHVFHVHR